MNSPLLASVVIDPAWPWSERGGLLALGLTAIMLTGLTVWTYFGAAGANWRRVAAVVALRLAALAVACLLVLRPSFAEREESVTPTKLLFLCDSSASMDIRDEFNNQSRWEAALKLLRNPAIKAALEDLQKQHKVEVLFFQGAEDLRKFDPDGKPDGKRTDVGLWLHELRKQIGGDSNLRGLLLFSDGADNGTRYAPLEEAAQFRGIPCPIHPFLLGSAGTTLKQNDIALVDIQVKPAPIPVKTKMAVKAVVHAPGFVDQRVKARLLIDDKEVAEKTLALTKTLGNEIDFDDFRPEKPGEIKVTVKIDPVDGEVTTLNNEISTFATVTKEGVSILWVEGKKRTWEPVFAIRHALARDPRFSVFYAERLLEAKPSKEPEDLFDFKKKHYDVVVIGDVSASRFSGNRPEVFRDLREMVQKKGTGLMMLGGYETFGNSDWQKDQDIAALLPVDLNVRGQVKEPVRVRPTPAGEQHYLLRLGGKELWEQHFEPLDGMVIMGKERQGATVLAVNQKAQPVLVGDKVGEGRVLAFGGDTTWKAWRRNAEAIVAYERFWKQALLWLARQDEAEGNVFVKLDTRRIPAGAQRLGFTVGLRGKEGSSLKNGQFKVKVTGPRKDETEVPTSQERGEDRGYFWKTSEPGEYVIEVSGKGQDLDGKEIVGTAKSRFIVYAEDLENMRPAADHEFLKKLAQASGGATHLPGEQELLAYLNELKQPPSGSGRTRAEVWPDWRRTPVSGGVSDQVSALWASGALICFIGFVALLTGEWVIRRRWGMV